MQVVKRSTELVLFACILIAACPRFLYAYLDPGTGSYFFQILIGVLLGSLLAIKIFWGRIRAFIRGLFASNKSDVKGDE